jgi:hypothetical protein
MSEEFEKMKAFINKMINVCYEGGSLDGGDIQEELENHGLLIKHVVYEPCETDKNRCNCSDSCSIEEF